MFLCPHGPRSYPVWGRRGTPLVATWRRAFHPQHEHSGVGLLTGTRHISITHAHEDKHLTYRLTRLRIYAAPSKTQSHGAWGQVRSIFIGEARAMHLLQDAHYYTPWAVGNRCIYAGWNDHNFL